MGRLIPFIFVLSALITASCSGSKELSLSEKESYKDLKILVESRNFEIVHDFANSSIANNINLIGNENYIRFKEDSVRVYLPFYGIRYWGGYANSENGIKYSGKIRGLEIIEKPAEGKIILKFEALQQSETLNFIISLYSNKNVYTAVNNSERSSISYRGNVSEIDISN